MSNIFDKHYKEYDAWYDKNKFAYLSELEAIKKVLPKRGKGLEIGVGTGRFASALGIKFGIDPSERMLETAKQRGINVRAAYGEKLPFENSTFNYVAIIITLCFVKNPQKVLKEAKRVLKKGGKIIIGIVDKDSFLGKFYESKKKESKFYKHANFYSVGQVLDWLKKLKFEHINIYQTIFKIPKRTIAIEPVKEGYGDGGFVVIAAQIMSKKE
ncbi:MAG: class I SAM-dependent methyltransferase [bacterium]